MFYDLVKEARTIRHFDVSKPVTDENLSAILECARLAPSAANLQRIRYASVVGDKAREAFSYVAFAGYLPADKKPNASVSATAYLVLMTKCEIPDVNLSIDLGIAAEIIQLAARDMGLGACMIRSFNKEYFDSIVSDTECHPQLVIALGTPVEKAKIVGSENGNIKYYKDEENVNCVPKLSLGEIYVKVAK